MQDTQVLIIGAGPAGLTSALLLARYGVKVILVEKHPGTSIHPKARGLNVRTMEILRSLGLAGAVQEAGQGLEKNRYMLFVESLAGKEIRRIVDDDLMMKGDALAEYTPCTWTQCSQDELEHLLLTEARKAGAEVRFNSEMVNFEENGDLVRCIVRDVQSGEEQQLTAGYVLACDGSASPTRKALGIELEGRSAIEHFVNIYFRCDLRKYVEDRWFGICFVENERVNGLFLPVDNEEEWLFNVQYDPAHSSVEGFTVNRCRDLLQAAIGETQEQLEILSILPWVASALVAPRLRIGRVFLVGDAGHIMPPAGGFGLNTAIQDAHNLAWKLAYVLQGKAGSLLLESYEQERLPIAQSAVKFAEQEMDAPQPWEHGAQGNDKADIDGNGEHEERDSPWEQSLEDQLRAVIGFQYKSVAVDEGEAIQGLTLNSQPGTRLPHVQMEGGASTLDLVQQQFVIVTSESTVKSRSRIPLSTIELERHDWEKIVRDNSTEAILVRPDGIVAAAGTWDTLISSLKIVLDSDQTVNRSV